MTILVLVPGAAVPSADTLRVRDVYDARPKRLSRA